MSIHAEWSTHQVEVQKLKALSCAPPHIKSIAEDNHELNLSFRLCIRTAELPSNIHSYLQTP